MNKLHTPLLDTFSIAFGLPSVSYSSPPDDPLNELTTQEMNLRRFCHEHDHEVFIKFNNKEVKVYLDPDILMLMEDNFLQNLKEFKQSNKELRIDFVESCDLTIKFIPEGEMVQCTTEGDIENKYTLDKKEVSIALDMFICSFYKLALDTGYTL